MIKQTHTVVDIAIVCSDFDKSLEFYRDQLGFEIAVELEISAELATQVGLAPSGFRARCGIRIGTLHVRGRRCRVRERSGRAAD